MGELSALVQDKVQARNATIVQLTSLSRAQDKLTDLLSKQLTLSRKNDLKEDAQLVKANKIVAGHQGTQTDLPS